MLQLSDHAKSSLRYQAYHVANRIFYFPYKISSISFCVFISVFFHFCTLKNLMLLEYSCFTMSG